MEAIIEGRGFIQLPPDADPAALFSEPFLSDLLGTLANGFADSRPHAIAGNLAKAASDTAVVEHALALTTRDAAAKDVAPWREDVYVPVAGAYEADVCLKWIFDGSSRSSEQQFELKYNRDWLPHETEPNVHPALYEKVILSAGEVRNSAGAIDVPACIAWAVTELKKRRLDELAAAVGKLLNPGAPRYSLEVAGFRFADMCCPLVVLSKPRARTHREKFYTGAFDTYQVEAAFVRMVTVLPPAAAGTQPRILAPRYYYTVSFENDNSPRFNLRIVERHMIKLTQRWHSLADRQPPGQTHRVHCEGYPKMVALHLASDLDVVAHDAASLTKPGSAVGFVPRSKL
jgi:hypothetical protein